MALSHDCYDAHDNLPWDHTRKTASRTLAGIFIIAGNTRQTTGRYVRQHCEHVHRQGLPSVVASRGDAAERIVVTLPPGRWLPAAGQRQLRQMLQAGLPVSSWRKFRVQVTAWHAAAAIRWEDAEMLSRSVWDLLMDQIEDEPAGVVRPVPKTWGRRRAGDWE